MKFSKTKTIRKEFRVLGINPKDVCSVSVAVDQLEGFRKYLLVKVYERK